MSRPGQPPRARLLRRVWPAWPAGAALIAIPVGNVVGGIPLLRPYRVDGWVTVLAVVVIVLAGLPCLLAWAAWSALGIRHPAARTGLIAGFAIADLTLFSTLFLVYVHPQM